MRDLANWTRCALVCIVRYGPNRCGLNVSLAHFSLTAGITYFLNSLGVKRLMCHSLFFSLFSSAHDREVAAVDRHGAVRPAVS